MSRNRLVLAVGGVVSCLLLTAHVTEPTVDSSPMAEQAPLTLSPVQTVSPPKSRTIHARTSVLIPSSAMAARRESDGIAVNAEERTALLSTLLSAFTVSPAAADQARDLTFTQWKFSPKFDHGEGFPQALFYDRKTKHLYFINPYSSGLARLDPERDLFTEWTLPGVNKDAFAPNHVTVGRDGRAYYTDFGLNRIGCLDPDTNTVTFWTIPRAPGDPEVIGPAGLDFDSNGDLWVMGYKNHTVYRLTPLTNVLTAYPIPHDDFQSTDLLVDTDDNVVWIGQETNTISILFPMTNLYKEWPIPSARTPFAIQPDLWTSNPNGISLGREHEIFVAETAMNKVARLNTDTNVYTEWTLPIPDELPSTTISVQPFSTAVGHNKNRVYFSERTSNRIGMINTHTNVLTEWRLPQNLDWGPRGLVIDAQHNRLFFISQALSRIGMLDLAEDNE